MSEYDVEMDTLETSAAYPFATDNSSEKTTIYYELFRGRARGPHLSRELKEIEIGVEPLRMTPEAVGFDLTVPRHYVVDGESAIFIDTLVKLYLPQGVHAMILPRSSAFCSGILVHPGLIDTDYTGRLVILARPYIPGRTFVITKGRRIAQLVFFGAKNVELVNIQVLKDPNAVLNVADSTEEEIRTARGSAGFGSTGGKIVM